MSEHRVLICGGRAYRDWQNVERVLDTLNERPTVIIEGGALGADAYAKVWAAGADVLVETYEADWRDLSHSDARIRTDRYGRRYDAYAGPRRNQRMIDEGKPDLVIAFSGGNGTADMVRRAKAAGVRVIEVPE